MACEATPKLLKMNPSSHLLVAEFPQMTVLNLVLGGTIFTEGGHFGGGGGEPVHYDNVIVMG